MKLYVFIFSTRAKSPQPVLEREEAEEEYEDKVRLDSCEFFRKKQTTFMTFLGVGT